MSIPSAPATKALSESLNVVGKNVRTYRFKFNANWNLKPLKQSLTQFGSKDFKNLGNLIKAMNEQKNLLGEIKDLKKTAEVAKQAKGAADTVLKGAPGGSLASKAAAVGNSLVPLFAIGGIAAIVALQAIVNNLVQDSQDKRSDILDSELTKVNGRALQALDRARIVNEKVEAQKLENQRTKDRIYGVEQQLPKIRDNANNALYETREGRKIVEGKIAEAKKQSNDALYEVRENVKRFNGEISKINADVAKYLSGVKDGFQQRIETTFGNLQKGLEQAKADAKNAEEKTISLGKIVSEIQAKVGQVLAVKIPTIPDIVQQVIPSVKAAINGDFLELKNDISTLKISKNLLEKNDSVLASGIQNVASNLATVDAKVDKIRNSVSAPVIPDSITRDIDALKKENLQLKPDIEKLKKDIGEQDKLNREGLEKIKDIIPMIAGIPIIVGRDITNLRNTIPTPKDITAATGTAICNSANGGCLGNALNNQTNNINKNTNDALDKANSVANAAEIALLTVIDNKLGPQLPGGGISNFLKNFFDKFNKVAKWLHLDRALNILIWWQTLHNAYMLSANLGQTLTSAISNVLAAIGIKDADGNPLDIGTVLGNQFDSLAKSVIGESEWGGIKAEYKKWNRIYQAAANLMNSIQSIGYSILSALEVVGSWVASIGNALRKWGEVGETAYRWMNPTPNFQNKFFTTLENVENVVSQVDQVASEVLSVQETVTQIGTQKTELEKALQEDDSSKQGATPPEATKVKGAADESKRVSANGVAITDKDKEADE